MRTDKPDAECSLLHLPEVLISKVMVILVPFLVCIIGLLAYALSANPKIAEVGRIAYAFGLLVTLLEVAGHVVSLLR